MTRGFRAVLVAAAGVATLAFANGAFAANTGSLSVYHTPMSLASTGSTTIRVSVPQTTDPIAALRIYSGTGYTAKLDQAAGTKIGTVDASALSRDNNLTLPLSGDVTTDNPATAANKAGSVQCAGLPQSAAVWVMNLSVAGNTLPIPIYVNPTDGAPDQALGGYRMSICLPPPDVPLGTPGRSFQGAQLLLAELKLNGIFTTPTGGGLVRWEGLFTPYTPGKGTPNAAGTFETRAFVPLPIILGLHRSYVTKSNMWRLNGKLTEGGQAVAGVTVTIRRGPSATRLTSRSAVKTDAQGNWSTAGHLTPKRTTYFQITSAVPMRVNTTTGCANPTTAAAPAGCVNATFAPWNTKSTTLKFAVVKQPKKK
jgi:hypothetical protein